MLPFVLLAVIALVGGVVNGDTEPERHAVTAARAGGAERAARTEHLAPIFRSPQVGVLSVQPTFQFVLEAGDLAP